MVPQPSFTKTPAQQTVLTPQRGQLQRSIHPPAQVGVVERLGQVVESAALHGLDRTADIAVGGDQNHRQVRRAVVDRRHQRQTVHARHAPVRHHHVGTVGGQHVERLVPAGRRMARVAGPAERFGQGCGHLGLVVDDEDPCFHAALLLDVMGAGKATRKQAPVGSASSMKIDPPCASTI